MSKSGRYVHTIWCDDIRQEVGNKPSFMGVFTGGILLPGLPMTLPKLGVYTWIISPIESSLESLRLQIVRDDGFVLADLYHEKIEVDAAARHEGAISQQIVIGAMTGVVEIPVECKWFVVRVTADGEELEGPKLRVAADMPNFAAMMGSLPSA